MSSFFRRRPAVSAVSVREAQSLHEHGALLVDVREPFEWNAGHAPGARHIPLGQLPRRLADLPMDKRIVLVCRSGNRSAQATSMLTAAGFEATNLTGGMAAWARAGHPIVTNSGAPGAVA